MANQKANGNRWVLLGTNTFATGTGGYVRVRTDGTAGYVIADAVKLVKVTEVVGYRLYHGTASRGYGEAIDVGNSTAAEFLNPSSGCSNFFAVTAVNSSGLESVFSDELALFVPSAIVVSTNALSILESHSATFQVRLDAQTVNMTTVLVSRVGGGSLYLGTVSGTALVFSPSNWSSNQTVTIAALYDPVKTNRTSVFELSGEGLLPSTVRVSSMGVGQNVTDGNDVDGNGIPDAWEIVKFGGLGVPGTASQDDGDQDGCRNLSEYLAGTDPCNSGSFPALHVRAMAGQRQISFDAIQAEAVGYEGKTRFYTLEHCVSLHSGVWSEVPGQIAILAQNQTVNHTVSDSASGNGFYRIQIRLQ
jgi:hypothetical protein